MGCSSCSSGKDGKPGACQSNGGCSSGGCNRLNTYDWLSVIEVNEPDPFNLVEVSFKNGARKNFYQNEMHTGAITGDWVVVDSGNGSDVGKISLSGELVRLQMKKKKIKEATLFTNVLRVANVRDLEKLSEARSKERETMIRARAIVRTLSLDMKIGDVEYQGDKRKCTFYYTADGRVDFRELIRQFAKEFRVKIEMRQIGARQESARIGGLGSCGRELCCSTWLSDFKSVSTAAARYQNLAINQSKLSGQCGRLKCCLNYELDTYLDALQEFPKKAESLRTEVGKAILVKTDIFKGLMYYVYQTENSQRGKFYPLPIDRVKAILAMNKKGDLPLDLVDINMLNDTAEELIDFDDDLTGVIELPPEERRRKRRNSRNKRRNNRSRDRERSRSIEKPKSKDKSNSSNTRSKSNDRSSNDDRSKSKSSNRSKSNDRSKQKPKPNDKNSASKENKPLKKKAFKPRSSKKIIKKKDDKS